MQDFTGVPAIVDLAAMRDALVASGVRSKSTHSVMLIWSLIIMSVDHYGTPDALAANMQIEMKRNKERYQF